jgi:arylsulfatase A-like enzyme
MPEGEPFFMYVGCSGAHSPYIVPKKFLDMYPVDSIRLPDSFNDHMHDKPNMYRRIRERYDQLSPAEHLECLRHYLAYCTYEDHLFGRLLDALEKRGLLSDTIVTYTSDHGDYAASHGLWEKGLPSFKEAYHVNSVVGYGGVAPRNGVEDAFVSLADYAPTFLDLAGVKANRRFAGQSLAPFLRGGKPENWRTDMFTQTNGNENYGIQRAVFDRDFKYVYNAFDYDELYDLQNDPHETRNLRGQPGYEGLTRRMWEKLWRFAFDNRDDISNSYTVTAMQPYGPGIMAKKKKKVADILRPERASRFSEGRSPSKRPPLVWSPERAARIPRTTVAGRPYRASILTHPIRRAPPCAKAGCLFRAEKTIRVLGRHANN